MGFRAITPGDAPAVRELFVSVFSQAEGEGEGALVGRLAGDLMAHTDHRDLYGFVAVDADRIDGAIFFSRLTFEHGIDVFILAPVAVRTEHQGRGIGQALIRHGLEELRRSGVRVAVTYGDPAYYARVGFEPLSQDVIRPPLALSRPEGWLGRSLTGEGIEPIPGPCSCVAPLDDPAYW